MVILKSKSEIEKMKKAGRLSAQALELGGKSIVAGMTTKELDRIIHDFIVKNGAKPSFLNFNGFTGSACISINEEIIHGIPSRRVIKNGDVVSIDVGAYLDGYHGDNAATFAVGEVSLEIKDLLRVTEESLYQGIKHAVVGNRVGDIANAIETHINEYGYGIVREYRGHGVGRNLHEEPDIPNFGKKGRGQRLEAGMTFAIEPMVNLKGDGIIHLDDGWTVVTKSKTPSAHFEHTIAITDDGPVILTNSEY